MKYEPAKKYRVRVTRMLEIPQECMFFVDVRDGDVVDDLAMKVAKDGVANLAWDVVWEDTAGVTSYDYEVREIVPAESLTKETG